MSNLQPDLFNDEPAPLQFHLGGKITPAGIESAGPVACSIRPTRHGDPEIWFHETSQARKLKDQLQIQLKLRKDMNLSALAPVEPSLPGIDTGQPAGAMLGTVTRMEIMAAHIVPRFLAVLEAIHNDASDFLTIEAHRIDYTRRAWDAAVKTMKKGMLVNLSAERLNHLQDQAIGQHRKDLAEYEATRQKTNNAPVNRRIANTSRLYQAASRGLSIKLDGQEIDAKADWANIQAALTKAQESGQSDKIFAAAALQLEDYTGLEILALVSLIQLVRERAGLERPGSGIQNKLEDLVMEPDKLLERLGLIDGNTNRMTKVRQRERLETAFRRLAGKEIKLAPVKSETGKRAVIKGYQSGFFIFRVLEVSDGEHDAGSWQFTGLGLIQVLSKDDMPFRPIPTDPFIYIAQEADPREMDNIMRAAWDILLAASFSQARQEVRLAEFNLVAGNGIPAEIAKNKQAILTHAIERYTGGKVEINGGILEYTPGKPLAM